MAANRRAGNDRGMSESQAMHVQTTPSGLQVVAIHRPWSKMFAATLMYRVGTFDDLVGFPGTAHFAEHLAFAGENKQMFAKVAASGTQVNGATGYDHTRFLTAGHVDDLDHSINLFANILRNERVTESDIAGERDVFLHELESDDDESRRMRHSTRSGDATSETQTGASHKRKAR